MKKILLIAMLGLFSSSAYSLSYTFTCEKYFKFNGNDRFDRYVIKVGENSEIGTVKHSFYYNINGKYVQQLKERSTTNTAKLTWTPERLILKEYDPRLKGHFSYWIDRTEPKYVTANGQVLSDTCKVVKSDKKKAF